MSEEKCPFCATPIPSGATVCTGCNAVKKKEWQVRKSGSLAFLYAWISIIAPMWIFVFALMIAPWFKERSYFSTEEVTCATTFYIQSSMFDGNPRSYDRELAYKYTRGGLSFSSLKFWEIPPDLCKNNPTVLAAYQKEKAISKLDKLIASSWGKGVKFIKVDSGIGYFVKVLNGSKTFYDYVINIILLIAGLLLIPLAAKISDLFNRFFGRSDKLVWVRYNQ